MKSFRVLVECVRCGKHVRAHGNYRGTGWIVPRHNTPDRRGRCDGHLLTAGHQVVSS